MAGCWRQTRKASSIGANPGPLARVDDLPLNRRLRISRMSWVKLVLVWVLALAPGMDTPLANPANQVAEGNSGKIFAHVGDRLITEQEFAEALQIALRQKYYHGRPPEDQQQAFQREVAENLITRVLLLDEAQRVGIKNEDARVQAQLDRYTRRGVESPRGPQQGAQQIAWLEQRLRENDLLRQLEARVKRVPAPSEAQLKVFYFAHPEKFTEPTQHRISLILLGVHPSSPAEKWRAAFQQAGNLIDQLRGGANFADLARLHSTDASAEKGGDLGYLHKGMLGAPVEKNIEQLEVGEISAPIRVLEGVAMLRLDAYKPARLRIFEEVRERARELWQREQGNKAWLALQNRLRAATRIEMRDLTLTKTKLDGADNGDRLK